MTKSDKPTSKPTAPIVDVVRPNESAPSATSIPVIVNNRPILRDPMMAASDVPNIGKPDSETSKLATVSTKINIQPVTSDDPEIEEAKKPEVTEAVAAPVNEAEPVSPESTVPDTEDPSNPKSAEEKIAIEAEKASKQEVELQGLVDSKKYFLPINTVEKRRTKRFVAVGAGISILLVIIWVDVALDAGLIKIGGLKALSHIFST